ncbi:hypothetical protein CCACVL1_18305 [Corchorus capsularis]|uniref:Uncharacterized protein n=1 Tax=Corchorus capsularis TaxID=210143 RepID=A0A1R3HLX1_COCAP|nr:hypothetical protein CCACVL1_18305 [Corchorus capsularis]
MDYQVQKHVTNQAKGNKQNPRAE